MKTTEEFFTLPGADGQESWRAGGREGSAPLEPGTTKTPDWIALPMRSVVSIPMRFPAMEPLRREAAAQLELEGLGLTSLTSDDFDIHTRDAALREQRSWVTAQVGALPAATLADGMEARYAPSVSFRTLKHQEVSLWHEGGLLTVAIPDEHGQPLHAQSLTARHADEDAAAELRCILAALDLAGIAPETTEVVVQTPANAPATDLGDFARAIDLPVSTETSPLPKLPNEGWRLVPPPIVQRRYEQKQRQTFFLAAAGAVLVIMVMLGTFAGRLWSRERSLIAESARIEALEPELNTIRDAQAKSLALDTAVNRDKSANELYHQVASLLPDDGLRIESFELTENGYVRLRGEASNQQYINRLRDDLGAAAAFAGLLWDFPAGAPKPDGKFSFTAECAPPVAPDDASS